MSAKIQPKPQKDTIYLEADDEITAIIEKVESAQHKVVALVLPKRMTSLQSTVNMRLLKRGAEKADKNVVLITSDPTLLALVGAAGMYAAKNLQSKPEIPSPAGKEPETDSEVEQETENGDEELPTKLDYHRTVGELAAVHAVADDGEAIDLDDDEAEAEDEAPKKEKKAKEPKTKGLKVPNFDKFRASLGIGGIVLIGLIAFLVMAIFVLPKTAITIRTESIPVNAEFSLKGSDSAKTLDMEKMIIPVQTKTSEQTSTSQVTATGQQNNGEKATGSVTLANCTDNPVTVPAGTGVSSSGLTYILQSSVALSDGEFTSGGVCKSSGSHIGSGSVKAQTGGTKYNIGPSSFSVAGFPGISGSSSSAMTGGTDNITTVVSQADVDNAKSKITSGDTDTFSKKFQADLEKQGFYVLTSTLKVGEPVATSSPAVGQPASNATVTVKITYTVFTVTEADLTKAVTTELEKKIDPKKQELSDQNVLKDISVDVQNPTSPNDLVLNINQTAAAIPIIDKKSIQTKVGGMKSSEIKSSIGSFAGVKSVDVKMSPFWVSKAPKKPNKVTVVVVPVKTDGNTSKNEQP